MFLHRLNSANRRLVAIAFAGVLSVSGWAQDTPPAAQSGSPQSALPQAPQPMRTAAQQPQKYTAVDYSKPRSQFPNVIAPYTPAHVPPPNLSNTERIQQLMHDGKIMLSMNDAVALALENNLDLVLARYNLNIADTDILRANAVYGAVEFRLRQRRRLIFRSSQHFGSRCPFHCHRPFASK